jgi:hypothetical protein
MSCALTSGYALGCRNSVGGIKNVRLAALAGTVVSTNGSGTVSGVTTSPASGFYLFELPKQTSQFTETITGSTENGTIFYQQDLQIVLNRMSVALRNQIRLLAQQRLVAIVEDRNGVYWMLGSQSGLELNTGTSQTGTAMGDRNGYDLTLTALEEQPMLLVTGSIVSGITNSAGIQG